MIKQKIMSWIIYLIPIWIFIGFYWWFNIMNNPHCPMYLCAIGYMSIYTIYLGLGILQGLIIFNFYYVKRI